MVVCRRLVELLKASSQKRNPTSDSTLVRLQIVLLQCISNLVRFDNVQTQIFLNNCSLLVCRFVFVCSFFRCFFHESVCLSF
jgi:hypothetical protein